MDLTKLITSTIGAGRNAIVTGKNTVLERYFQYMLGEAGTVSNLALNSRAKTLAFDLALKGETEMLRVEILRYSVERNERGTWLILHEVNTSREWANILAKKYLPLPASKVPDWAAAAVSLML